MTGDRCQHSVSCDLMLYRGWEAGAGELVYVGWGGFGCAHDGAGRWWGMAHEGAEGWRVTVLMTRQSGWGGWCWCSWGSEAWAWCSWGCGVLDTWRSVAWHGARLSSFVVFVSVVYFYSEVRPTPQRERRPQAHPYHRPASTAASSPQPIAMASATVTPAESNPTPRHRSHS